MLFRDPCFGGHLILIVETEIEKTEFEALFIESRGSYNNRN